MRGRGRRGTVLHAAAFVVGTALFAGLGGLTSPALAECDGPIPSFRDAVASAQRIVIGDVVGVHAGGRIEPAVEGGRSSRFTLRVRAVPLGAAPDVLEIRELGTQPCAPVVSARLGDRIAITFGATDFTPPIEVNTAAWITGTPPHHLGYETVTTAEVYSLLGLVPPDTATPDPTTTARPPSMVVPALAGLVALGILFARRAIRRQATS